MWKVTAEKYVTEKEKSLPYLGLPKEGNGHQSAAGLSSGSKVTQKPEDVNARFSKSKRQKKKDAKRAAEFNEAKAGPDVLARLWAENAV